MEHNMTENCLGVTQCFDILPQSWTYNLVNSFPPGATLKIPHREGHCKIKHDHFFLGQSHSAMACTYFKFVEKNKEQHM